MFIRRGLSPSATKIIVEQGLTNLLLQRYNPQVKALSLSAIATDPEIRRLGIRVDFGQAFVTALLVLISKCCPDVVSVDFSDNRIRNLEPFADLATFAPNLLNLSFERNQIMGFRDLDPLRSLVNLRELILLGNPIEQRKQSDASYRQYESPPRTLSESLSD